MPTTLSMLERHMHRPGVICEFLKGGAPCHAEFPWPTWPCEAYQRDIHVMAVSLLGDDEL